MDKQLLMVDDDRRLCELVRDYLLRFSFHVDYVCLPSLALKNLASSYYVAAIIDVMMPEMDGFELVRRIRQQRYTLPIIMLTARGDITDRVIGLELGADDYLPKPFEPRELAARITALMRRQSGRVINTEKWEFEELRIYGMTQSVEVKNAKEWKKVHLTDAEFKALVALVSARPAIVSRDELSAQLRGIDFDVADRSLDIMISRLRSKLGESVKEPRFIKTVRYSGYAFIAIEK